MRSARGEHEVARCERKTDLLQFSFLLKEKRKTTFSVSEAAAIWLVKLSVIVQRAVKELNASFHKH